MTVRCPTCSQYLPVIVRCPDCGHLATAHWLPGNPPKHCASAIQTPEGRLTNCRCTKTQAEIQEVHA